MHFSDEVYKAKAAEMGVVPDAGAISLFKRGHLCGLDAVKFVFSLRARQVPTAVQYPGKQIFMSTIEKLRSGSYDGRPIDDVIGESTRFLGERCALWKSIERANTCMRILSKDKTHALPLHVRCDVDPYDSRYTGYDEVFFSFWAGRPGLPRTRDEVIDILYEVEPEKDFHTYAREVDTIISYLVRKDLL